MTFSKRKDREFLIWFAGFFDGEGYIATSLYGGKKKYLQMYIGISNTYRSVIDEIEKNLEGNRRKDIHRSGIKGKIISRKPSYRLRWNGPRSQEILRLIYPFLRVKKKQAELALKFNYRNFSNGLLLPRTELKNRYKLMNTIRKLNGKNRPKTIR